MGNVNNGVLDGVRRIGAKVRDLTVDGQIAGAPLGFRLRGATASGYPTKGTWKAGDEVRDRSGSIWICTAGGSPGTWALSGLGLGPSGDTTGATDTAAIQGLLNLGGVVALQDGTFWTNAPLNVPAGVKLTGGKGCSPSVYDGNPPTTGTIIKASTTWSAGAVSPACVVQIGGAGVHLRDFWIDGTNVPSGVDGIADGSAQRAADLRNVGVYNVTGQGIVQAGSGWHLFECSVNQAGSNGFSGSWVDTILINCHAQTCGLNTSGASGFFINGGGMSKFVSCRGDLSYYGFTFSVAGGGSQGIAMLTDCSTQRNIRYGFRVTAVGGSGGRPPVLLDGCASIGDGINGTISATGGSPGGTITGGTGGGGYAGIGILGSSEVIITGFTNVVNTGDVAGGCPQYAIATATGSGSVPNIITLDNTFLNGVTGLVSDAAPASQFIIGTNVTGYVGAPYPGGATAVTQVTPSVLPAASIPVTSGAFLCAPTEYAPTSLTTLAVSSTSYATFGYSTTVAAGSNGGTVSAIASWSSPSAGVLDVASTTNFPTSGTLTVVASGTTTAVITYTGTSGGNQFTGCAYVSGSASGTVATGNTVALSGATSLLSTGSFTAPASGSVLVTATANVQVSASSGRIPLALAATGTVTPLMGHGLAELDGTSGLPRQICVRFLVGSLTAGTSYQFDLLGASAAGQAVIVAAYGQTTTSPTQSGSSVILTVQAV